MYIETLVAHTLLFFVFYFEVFLLVSFIERYRYAQKQNAVVLPTFPAQGIDHNNANAPSVCIVVPCFNEERSLAATIDSLLALSYPKEKLEIIVIDDGSTDSTYDIAMRYANAELSDVRVMVLKKENGGKHSALNLALTRTNAELIGCLDADSVVRPDALARLVDAFSDKRIGAVTPGIHVRFPKTLIQHIQNIEYHLAIFNRYAFSCLGSIFITPGPFSIFRTDTVNRLGGWRHGHSTEDMELGLRLQEHGWRITNDPLASVQTAAPKTLTALVRQRIRWVYGFFKNIADYRHMIGNPRFGNLGLIVLPAAIISIFSALFFTARAIWYGTNAASNAFTHYQVAGFQEPSFDPFFISTSTLLLLMYMLVALTVILIALGSHLAFGRRLPPATTPLFLTLYGFLAPLWLGTALVKAIFNTGVSWR